MDNKRTIMPNGRYTDGELELLKNVFAEDLPLVKIARKIMLQLPMSEAEEIRWIKTISDNGDLKALLSRMFFPELDGDAPLHQIVDIWILAKSELENKLPEEQMNIIKSKQMVIDYMSRAVKELTEGEDSDMRFNELDLLDPIQLTARNYIVSLVETVLNEIFGLAGLKKETPEETIKRLSQNSNK